MKRTFTILLTAVAAIAMFAVSASASEYRPAPASSDHSSSVASIVGAPQSARQSDFSSVTATLGSPVAKAEPSSTVASIVGSQKPSVQREFTSMTATLGAPVAKSQSSSSLASIVGAPQSEPVQVAATDSPGSGLALWEGFLIAGLALVPLLIVVSTFVRRRGPVGSPA